MAYRIESNWFFAGDPTDPEAPAYYADKDGFVPQTGDNVEDFTSRSGEPYDPEYVGPDGLTWEEWVTAAERAVARAKTEPGEKRGE